jgi:Domain of unknown function (DUF222)/HNH endonuclease
VRPLAHCSVHSGWTSGFLSYPAGSVRGVDGRLAALDAVVRECVDVSWWAVPPASLSDSVDLLHRVSQQASGLLLAAVGQAVAQGVPAAEGASSLTAWLKGRLRISGGEAARLAKLAAAVAGDLPRLGAALTGGGVNVEQARVIAARVADVPPEIRAEAERRLIGDAATFGPRELGLLGGRIVELVAPEVGESRELAALERAEQRAHQTRSLKLHDEPDSHRVKISGWLDREGAAYVRAALDPLCTPRPVGNGPDSPGERDPRSPEQRRADALVEVCRLASTCGELPDNGGDRPQVVVTMSLNTLRSQAGAATLDDGADLSAEAARRIACDAAIIPAVLNGAGQVLDLGRTRRLFTGPVRRAIVLRDRGCTFPGCDRPPTWTQVHHIIHWQDGGPTNPGNAALLCGHHHRVIHQGDWQIRTNPTDGLPEFIPPSYLDKLRRPRRNTYHRRH